MSVETIATLADETAVTMTALKEALTAAQSFNDRDLQPHAVQARRAALEEQARTTASESIAGITSRAESAATTAAKLLDGSRPKIAVNDPAALIRAEQAWNYDVKPLLESGASIKAVLKDAGVDELLAIERFAGGYLRAAKLKAGPGNPLELDPDELAAAVNNRLAVTLPEDQRAAFEDGILSADAAERLRAIHEVAADTIAGRRPSNDTEAYARARTLAGRLRG
jgi:hypothetical protein